MVPSSGGREVGHTIRAVKVSCAARRGACVSALGCLVLAGCFDGAGSSDHSRLERQIERIGRYDGFPLWWGGRRVANLPLTVVGRGAEHFGEGVSFIYGTCDPGTAESCAPPLVIQVTNLCNRLPRDLGLGRRVGARMRGALTSPAEAGADNGPSISLYLKGATVTVYPGNQRLQRAAVRALRPANALARLRDGDLPAATPAEVAGEGC
jgi:hypothetical protein